MAAEMLGEHNLTCAAIVLQLILDNYDPLRENVTSSTNPEVHNVSQRCQRRTDPRPFGEDRMCTVFPEICSPRVGGVAQW